MQHDNPTVGDDHGCIRPTTLAPSWEVRNWWDRRGGNRARRRGQGRDRHGVQMNRPRCQAEKYSDFPVARLRVVSGTEAARRRARLRPGDGPLRPLVRLTAVRSHGYRIAPYHTTSQ